MTARDLRSLFAHAIEADPRPDAELLAAPDEAAFAELVRRHGPLVWAASRRLLGEADAADAFQAVFLALHRSRHRIRSAGAVGAWLHAAAVRVALAHRRQAGRRHAREARAARPEAGVPVADAAWDALLAAVHQEVERLPAGERAAFVLCELQGVSRPEAAERLGWTGSTLISRLSRARGRLLDRLTARGLAPAAGLAGVGTVAVPAAVTAKAVGCVGPAAEVAPAVLSLSREVTTVVTIKYLAAAVVVAAGLMAGVGGGLVAQDGGRPPGQAQGRPGAGAPPDRGGPGRPGHGSPADPVAEPPVAAGRVGGMGPGGMGQGNSGPARQPRPMWEHKTVLKPRTPAEWDDVVAQWQSTGWEFAGTISLETAQGRPADFAVFKRPAGGPSGGPSGPATANTGGGPGGRGNMAAGRGSADPMAGPPARVFTIPLRQARAADVARVLTELFGPPVRGAFGPQQPAGLVVTADEARNMLLVRTADHDLERQVKEVVDQLDSQPARQPAPRRADRSGPGEPPARGRPGGGPGEPPPPSGGGLVVPPPSPPVGSGPDEPPPSP